MPSFEPIDPDNIPGLDYYLDTFKEPDNGYLRGFVTAANAWIEPFSMALKKSRELDVS